ncbi:hypothetical protein L596_008714 [Steinernema carpocapsae]|uniref:Uncharacterized protein n=1 Tax=Steinernema carpocapsae TaxID=34508 RepID=A0A4V6A6I7_STECR|nr:hypothetical protein L596_008714 [Steinernema carpocapsae]
MKFLAFSLLLLVASAYCCQPISDKPKPNDNEKTDELQEGKTPQELKAELATAQEALAKAKTAHETAKNNEEIAAGTEAATKVTELKKQLANLQDYKMKQDTADANAGQQAAATAAATAKALVAAKYQNLTMYEANKTSIETDITTEQGKVDAGKKAAAKVLEAENAQNEAQKKVDDLKAAIKKAEG